MSFKTKKRFGQNFLCNHYIIDQIICLINPRKDEFLLEIGPGQGALTSNILKQKANLIAVEIDRDLVLYLQNKFAQFDNLYLLSQDALNLDLKKITADYNISKIQIFGNLPYNISTPLLFHLISQKQLITEMIFMLQKEVVDRITAVPDNKNYGRLSVMMQYHCSVESLLAVDATCFQPEPKIESAVMKLTPHQILPYKANNELYLEKIVKQAFSQRRKTIAKNLKEIISAQQLEQLNISPKSRAENLTVADYVNISNHCTQIRGI